MSAGNPSRRWRFVRMFVPVIVALAWVMAPAQGGDKPKAPVKVTIKDEKPVVVEPVFPIDPTVRIRYQSQNNLGVRITTETGAQLHLSHFPMFKVDGQVVSLGFNPGVVGKFEVTNAPLPKGSDGNARHGFMSVWVHGDLRVTMMAEVVPTTPLERGQKARLDSVLVRYTLENKGKQSRKLAVKAYIDTYIISNDAALFAAPTMPGKILNGVELKGKTLPDYVQVLQRQDLKNPGFVAHLTLNVGRASEKAGRVVLASHGSFSAWDMPVTPTNTDSALAMYWEEKVLPPGAKRDVAYAYGQGIALGASGEGNMSMQFAGSFEPGKLFSVMALVNGPMPGQQITLDLPLGMERIEGKETQAVSMPSADQDRSFVLWKVRVLKTGTFPVRIRSSAGVTQTKIVTISKAE
jgi:hypothetical protein